MFMCSPTRYTLIPPSQKYLDRPAARRLGRIPSNEHGTYLVPEEEQC